MGKKSLSQPYYYLSTWILPSPKFGNRYRDPQTPSELRKHVIPPPATLWVAFINFPAFPRHFEEITHNLILIIHVRKINNPLIIHVEKIIKGDNHRMKYKRNTLNKQCTWTDYRMVYQQWIRF